MNCANFIKKIYKKEAVFVLQKKIIDDILILELFEEVKKYKLQNKKIALDLSFVEAVQSDLFIKALLDNKFKLFNINSQILSYLALILKDGFLKSYMDFNDFKNGKRELVKRRFLLAC